MPTPILATKLYLPPLQPSVISRKRLIKQLDAGFRLNGSFGRKLTLVSAAAGFGKTTLISEWVTHQCQSNSIQAAWLSLDEDDSDLNRFLTYLIAALQTITPTVGDRTLANLLSPQPPSIPALLTILLNEITGLSNNIILVFDDYHLIDAESVDHALTFLLTHLPPQLHLVIGTREDPSLPLPRLRVRGQLTELRAMDLRFTAAETAVFLNQMMGLTLSAEDINALERRTEGWIAGLQMAALSMQGRTDTAAFIKTFTGSHRYVVDYLVEEILQHQPAPARDFLLQTAILDRLTGSLCDAVTQQKHGNGTLEALERNNLFVIPLDDRRRWYRYHHLFADVLKARLVQEQATELSSLHQRASDWYEQNGLRSEAIRHALAAQNFAWAADLMELAWPTIDGSFQTAMWLGWVKAIPDSLIRARPVLSVAYGWALQTKGQLEKSEARFRDAEKWLAGNGQDTPVKPVDTMVVIDKAQMASLPASIATARAYRALALGKVDECILYAQKALDQASVADKQWRGAAMSLLGLAQYASGDLETANQSLTQFMTDMQQEGNILNAISIAFSLADIQVVLGRLHEAMRTYERALRLAKAQGEPLPLGTADLYRGMSELYCEWGDLETAVQQLEIGEKLGEQAALTNWPYRLHTTQALLKEAEGELTDALNLLNKAEQQHIRTPVPEARPVAILKTRLWAKQGKLLDAERWIRETGLSAEDTLSYTREFEHITLARVLLAQGERNPKNGQIAQALALLERLLTVAEAGGRTKRVIEVLILIAMAHYMHGNQEAAHQSLERALTLAEPEGFFQIFVNEGKAVTSLLAKMQGVRVKPSAYIDKLLATQQTALSSTPVEQPLIEPLSARELEILQLIAQGLSNREIGERLYLALSTVKGHNRVIFGKLQVQRRTEAVARARKLNLI